MLYDPHRDLYALFGVFPDADGEEIRAAIERQGNGRPARDLDEAIGILLDAGQRARYDALRAHHRVRQMIAFDRVRQAWGTEAETERLLPPRGVSR